MSWMYKNLQISDFLLFRHISTISQPKSANVASLLNVCWHFDTKTVQKVHKLHKNEAVEIFRLLWIHSEVLLKQNTVIFSSKMKCIARFSVVQLIVLELRTKSFGKFTEIASKTTTISNFSTIQVNLRHFSYKLNISCNHSSPLQRVCPRFRRFNTLVLEVSRYFDKNWTKTVKTGNFSKFVVFDVDSGQFSFEKLNLSLL